MLFTDSITDVPMCLGRLPGLHSGHTSVQTSAKTPFIVPLGSIYWRY